MHHPEAKQVKVRSPVHGAFHEFEAVNLAFDLALTPWIIQCCPNSCFIVLEIACELAHFTYRTRVCIGHPCIICCGKLISDHPREALIQVKHMLKLSVKRAYLIQRGYVLSIPLRRTDEKEIDSIPRRYWFLFCQFWQPWKTQALVTGSCATNIDTSTREPRNPWV